MSVPFLDLPGMHAGIAAELKQAIDEVVRTGAFILGPAVERFESAFAASTDRRHCVAMNSGTSALHLALLVSGVGKDDEVVTTPMTWISTSWAISYCGAVPVFADIDAETGSIDVSAADRAMTSRTRAILPVDLYGNPADLVALGDLAAARGIALVDDACQAHGSTLHGRPVGAFGDLACFSFYPGKNLGALGEGGAVVTDDDDVAERLRQLRDHAQSGRHHHVEIGFNYRMEGIQGAALDVKLRHLDDWNAQRRAAAARYSELLGGISGLRLPVTTPGADSNWHLYVVRVRNRDGVARSLQARGIDSMVHYPTPVHLQPAYQHLGHQRGDFPVAEAFADECLSLPMFPGISPAQQRQVADALADAIEKAA